MTDLEAIRARRSRRRYSGPPAPNQLQQLHQLARQAAAESGLILRLLEDSGDLFGGMSKTYGMFSGVNSFFLLAGEKAEPHLHEKAGWYGEKLVLEATKMGLGTCWVGGTFDRALLASTLTAGQQLVATITVGPSPEKAGFKERLVYSVARRGGKPAEQMMVTEGEYPAWFLEGVRAAARAPSALNRQPVVFRWLDETATASVKDPQGHELIDLGITKYHFSIAAGGKFAWGNGAAFAKDQDDD